MKNNATITRQRKQNDRVRAIWFATQVLGLVLLLSSCAHNISMFAKGKVFTLNETGLHYVNGEVVYEIARENSEMEAEFVDADGLGNFSGTSQIKGGMRVRRVISKQITGYAADLAKVCPEAVIAYLQDSSLPDLDPMPSPGKAGNATGTSGNASAGNKTNASQGGGGTEGKADSSGDKGNNDGLKEQAEEIIKEVGEKIEDYVGGNASHTEQDCENGECDPDPQADTVSGNDSASSVPTQDIWKGSPEEQKEKAYNSGQYLLIMYARSTCSNCKKVFENLQTDSFTKFLIDHNIVPTKYYSDAKGNTYNFAADYVTEGSDTLNLPSFILCKPLAPTGNTYAPGVDVEPIGVLPASLTDTEAKLEKEILKALE